MHFARFLYDDIEALGIPVSTDLHDWDGLTDHHREFALRSDLVFLSTAGAGNGSGPSCGRSCTRGAPKR